MNTAQVIFFRRMVRLSCAVANTHCDAVFDVARGVPRQGALRAELDARRLARGKTRATPGVRT